MAAAGPRVNSGQAEPRHQVEQNGVALKWGAQRGRSGRGLPPTAGKGRAQIEGEIAAAPEGFSFLPFL